MCDPRQPRSKWYDGPLYGHLVEPLLAGVHGVVLDTLPPGPRVLEACCGTGGLASRIAASGRQVLGVDLAPRNIALARQRHGATEDGGLRFQVGDVGALPPPDDGPYDIATVVMALHEMPSPFRQPLLRHLLSLARRVLIVDFASPMPWSLAGLRNRLVELAAGPEHFSGFLSFQREGGLDSLVRQLGARVEHRRLLDASTLQLTVITGGPPQH